MAGASSSPSADRNNSASDGDVKIEVANVDVSAEMNSDGTLCRKVKLKPYKMNVTFAKSGIVWQSNMMMGSIDVTATMWPANITRWSRPAAVGKLGAGGSVPMAAIHCA